ncbi:hypothetical protein S140_25 [Shewanella sp. phage 1/40]|uniref:hypothetical protein n=1 Tax=Shewanella sp. phage 1/40 TaxID=1458860 RepID=UPI0004F61AB7|nr:hypothetical protein S140_25 [Shewanella sp. phage 1/40]AHK11435.1 hypothetical protein S140_25 [Shewanella sp. phage 1/40]
MEIKTVIADTLGDMMDVLMENLTQGKRYEVLSETLDCYQVMNDNNVIKTYHKSWFKDKEVYIN